MYNIKCFFGIHKWKLGRLIDFGTSSKMDTYGNIGSKMQIRNCENCGKLGAKIMERKNKYGHFRTTLIVLLSLLFISLIVRPKKDGLYTWTNTRGTSKK